MTKKNIINRNERMDSESPQNEPNHFEEAYENGRYQSLSDDELLFAPADRRSSSEDGQGTPKSHRRTRSLCAFQLNEYSIGEIRRLHERLASRPPGYYGAKKSSFRNFSRSQVLVLSCLCLVNFISFCSMSILAPFFPKEASEKSMSASTSGLVFSFYAFIIFISSPIFGKIIPKIGAKFIFTSGLFVAGGCNLLFGVLEYIYEPWLFATFCFLIRGLEALGAAAYSTATYVFVVEVFPTNIGAVLGFMETFVGLGMSIGPALGGFLYSLAGFGLPFFTLGVILVLTVPLSLLLLPTIIDKKISRKGSSMLTLLSNPTILLLGAVIIVISIIWSFLDPTLEPHLRQFSLTPGKIGLVFLLFSGVYGITSPLWGWVSDHCNSTWLLMSIGLLFSSAALFMLGPAPFLKFIPISPWMTIGSLTLLGASVSLGLLPTFQAILDSAVSSGCRNDSSTYSLVAGAWSSLYALGEVIGPLAGGVLTEQYNFATCCTAVAMLSTALSGACFVAYFFVRRYNRNMSVGSTSDSGYSQSYQDDLNEEKPLLPSSEKHWLSEGDRLNK